MISKFFIERPVLANVIALVTILIGAVAICGLPPLNGYVSELFVYLGLLHGIGDARGGGAAVVLVAPILAMVGALAVACFVKVYGAVFLGHARTPAAMHVHEAPLSMRASAMVLAAGCILIGLAPMLVAPLLDAGIAAWAPALGGAAKPVHTLVPLGTVSMLATALVAMIIPISILLTRRKPAEGRSGM